VNGLRFLARRLVWAIPTLFGLITLTFFVTRVLPGDPTYSLTGPNPSPEQIAALQAQYGFDQPLLTQYWEYIKDVARLDFGTSLTTGGDVASQLVDRLPATLELIVLAITVAVLIGVAAGTLAARRAGKRTDRLVRGGSSVLLSVPDFWFGLLLLYVFYFQLGWAPPPIGQVGPSDAQPIDVTGAVLFDSVITLNPSAFMAAFSHAVLPVLSLGILLSAPIARLTRSAMAEALSADYIGFGRACGLPQRTLSWYALRAALPPVVTYVGIAFSLLLGGAVLIESIFSWGGAAQYAADAIAQNDFDPIQGFVFVAGVVSIVVFLIVDVLYMVLDPRVKL
jgi:peptide/nickel transport system permease protein